MTGTKNPSRKYFKRNQPYFYKSADNWEEWDTDESYDRTFFIGIDDSNPKDIDVALYMIWGGKAIAVVGSKVLDTVSNVVDTARQLEEEIQSILEEVQEITVALAQARVDVEEAIAEMNALVDRCEGILDGAEAARDLAQAWAVKMDGMVEEDGQPVDYSAKYYANEAKNSETAASTSATTASASATTATEQATAAATSAEQATTSASTAASYASTAHIDASGAANSATSAANSATNAANSATDSANSATASANSAQAAQDALNDVHGLIATPIGTIFQSIYVDESLDIARKLNGQLISSTKFTGFRSWLNTVQTAIPNLFTTETNWQAEKALSKFGQCGKFVIDDTAQTIRLPAVVNPQGLLSLSGIGNLINESLPNINISSCGTGETNSLYHRTAGYQTSYVARGDGVSGVLTDPFASLTSSTYQDNAPVQQEAIQYPYYIQVATGVEETLPAIREYEINNPFFFGQSMYSENAPYNSSWLASNGQWNPKTTYPDYYDWVLTNANSNADLFKLSTETYTDYDWVVNTANETFRLPLIGKRELVETYVEGTKWYRLYSDGWIEQGGTVTPAAVGTTYIENYVRSMNNIVDMSIQSRFYSGQGNAADVITTISNKTFQYATGNAIQANKPMFWSASGYTDITNSNLYYYVGDTVQDASLINAGAVLGQLATKTDFVEAAAASMPSNQYIDLTLGASGSSYTAPANGWFFASGNWASAGSQFHVTMDVDGEYGVQVPTGNLGPSFFRVLCPIKKGRTMMMQYTLATIVNFRFIYAEGDK